VRDFEMPVYGVLCAEEGEEEEGGEIKCKAVPRI